MIRVLLVDDSKIVLAILQNILEQSTDIKVVATAENGKQGLEAVTKYKPDVICADYHMPVMDGLEFTRQVMETSPTPILIISIAVQNDQQDNIYQLLDAGAVAILPKPQAALEANDIQESLIEKIKVLSGVSVFKRRNLKAPEPANVINHFPTKLSVDNKKLLVIGASTGGPQAFALRSYNWVKFFKRRRPLCWLFSG